MGITKAIAIALLASLALPALAQTRPAHKSHPQSTTEDDRAADALKEAESLLQKQQYPQAEEKLQTHRHAAVRKSSGLVRSRIRAKSSGQDH